MSSGGSCSAGSARYVTVYNLHFVMQRVVRQAWNQDI